MTTTTMAMDVNVNNDDTASCPAGANKEGCEAEARDNRQRDNQPANKRQTGGEAPVDKRRQGLDGH